MKLLIVFLMVTFGLVGQTINLQASPARPGAPVTVSVSVTGSTGIAALQWFIPILPGATYTAASASLPAGKTLTCARSEATQATGAPMYGCIVAGGIGTLTDGLLAKITFNAPTAGSYQLPISQQLGAAPNSDPVPLASGPPLALNILSPCDIDGDGLVNSTDVMAVLQQVLARILVAMIDVNGDGNVNVLDLQRVVVAAGGGACRIL